MQNMQKSKQKSDSATAMPNDFNEDLINASMEQEQESQKEVISTQQMQHKEENMSRTIDQTHSKEQKVSPVRIIKKRLNVNDSSINTNETYDRSFLGPNKYKDIVYPVSNSNINIKNYRIDNFKHLREKLDKIRLSSLDKKENDFDRIFQHTNKARNINVVNEINSLLINIDNIKTKESFSPDIKDSLLNSYKDFIAVNKKTKFYEGSSILDLKKDAFIKKMNINDVIILYIKLEN